MKNLREGGSLLNSDLDPRSVDSEELPNTLRWYALQVRARWERRVAESLLAKGYEFLLPTHSSRRHLSKGTGAKPLPLFPGYVFCRFSLWHGPRVITTPGVTRIVSFGHIPAPVPDNEIQALKQTVASGLLVEPIPYLNVGQSIRLLRGPLAGVQGILQQIRNQRRLILSVTLLQRSVAVELIDADFEVLSPSSPTSVTSGLSVPPDLAWRTT